MWYPSDSQQGGEHGSSPVESGRSTPSPSMTFILLACASLLSALLSAGVVGAAIVAGQSLPVSFSDAALPIGVVLAVLAVVLGLMVLIGGAMSQSRWYWVSYVALIGCILGFIEAVPQLLLAFLAAIYHKV